MLLKYATLIFEYFKLDKRVSFFVFLEEDCQCPLRGGLNLDVASLLGAEGATFYLVK